MSSSESGRETSHCCGGRGISSLHQNINEMEFERGIWSAALDGQLDRVTTFLEKSEDPNKQDSSGYTALHYASRNGHLSVVDRLLSYGASVNVQTRSGKSTPLHRAAYCGHLNIVKKLVDAGADPYLSDNDGNTPLHKAAEMGKIDVFDFLAKKETRLQEVRNHRGQSPSDCMNKWRDQKTEFIN